MYLPPPDLADHDPHAVVDRVPYAELHVHSNFSFLDGASHPEELIEEAARLRLDAVALTDHDGLYGAVRFATAGRALGVSTVFGAEMTLGLDARPDGEADPLGEHLLVLARGPAGYSRLSRVISSAHLRGAEKQRPRYDEDELAAELAGHAVILTGCRKGAVRRSLADRGAAGARDALTSLVDRFGRDAVVVELTDHALPLDSTHNDLLAGLAAELGLATVATGNVHYHAPQRATLADALAAIRARRGLDDMEGWLPAAGMAFLRSGDEMAAVMRRYPGAVARAAALGRECAFDLKVVAPDLPPFPVADGHTEASWLRHRTLEGARRRYGPPADHRAVYEQLDYELGVITQLGFPGYFLIVAGLVEFCRERGILCQGRGSAANSAVCYALGITNADPIGWQLTFERFLSADREGYPDIDLDIESGRREEVIQHVYATYGRRRAALVANVITYRARSAVRDAARALGYSAGQSDAYSKSLDPWSPLPAPDHAGVDGEPGIPEEILELARALEGFPRHLGIHPGGMVLADRPVSEVVPVEHATMRDRTILQWDKEDCASVGLVKFDLLGLGMLSAIRYTLELVAEHHGVDVDIAHLDLADEKVWDMFCAGDTVGVFQIESRAQMATLPRLRPRCFWDLAVEVGLIRPGPIQGGAVHPYLRRRDGEPWEHDHPLLARALDRTLGVILFQEQTLEIARDVAGFTGAEADELRRAMGSKRSHRKMADLRARFLAGAVDHGVPADLAENIFRRVAAFADYGFPLAHALSFAHIVFVSGHLKLYYPSAFCAGLLRAQPMGFYSPQSLITDARRHGVRIRRADITVSAAAATLEQDPGSTGGQAVRLGLAAVRAIGDDLAERIIADRDQHGAFTSIADLARRTGLTAPQLETLATAGALAGLEPDRRGALWVAGAAARDRPGTLPGTTHAAPPPALPGMTVVELLAADAATTGMTPDGHPIELLRATLDARGITPAARLRTIAPGTRVLVAGAVTHRQRPPTAGGVTFLSLEDETGLINVICSEGFIARYGKAVRAAAAVVVRGVLETSAVRDDGSPTSLNVVADRLEPIDLHTRPA